MFFLNKSHKKIYSSDVCFVSVHIYLENVTLLFTRNLMEVHLIICLISNNIFVSVNFGIFDIGLNNKSSTLI